MFGPQRSPKGCGRWHRRHKPGCRAQGWAGGKLSAQQHLLSSAGSVRGSVRYPHMAQLSGGTAPPLGLGAAAVLPCCRGAPEPSRGAARAQLHADSSDLRAGAPVATSPGLTPPTPHSSCTASPTPGPTAHSAPGTQMNPGLHLQSPHTPGPGHRPCHCHTPVTMLGLWHSCVWHLLVPTGGHSWHHGPKCVPGQCLHAALSNRQPGA